MKKSKRIHSNILQKMKNYMQKIYHGRNVDVVKQNGIVCCKGDFPDAQTVDNVIVWLKEFAKTHSLSESRKTIHEHSLHLEFKL